MHTKILGIALIVAGVNLMLCTCFNCMPAEKIADSDVAKINKQMIHSFDWTPVVGTLFLIGGILITARNKNFEFNGYDKRTEFT